MGLLGSPKHGEKANKIYGQTLVNFHWETRQIFSITE
jgi:hypothetical protein